jgi:1,2-diacylglycerol 3-alpha-glucosyltransferase
MPEFDPSRILVGQYIDSYLPTIDGVTVTVQNYARWLNQDHFPCYVATAKARRGYVDHEPYQIIRYNSVAVAARQSYRIGIPRLDREFVISQQDLCPNLVHAHSPFGAGNEALRLARQLKIPLIATFHSKFYDDILQATKSRLLAEAGVSLIVDFYNHADHVWTVNEGTAQTLREYGYKKAIEIMPNGTDFIFPEDTDAARRTVERRYALHPDDKVLLFVGQHVLQKNLLLLLEAVGMYARQGGRFKLLMVGDGYARQQLAEKARELGLAERVIFAGLVPDRAELSAIYLRSDVFTFPSVYDNAPLVVREAAMAGCPSILIAGSNAAENAEDGVNAYLCQNNAESLCRSIAQALEHDDLRRAIGQRARQTIGQPWQDVIKLVAARYKDIIANFIITRPRRPANRLTAYEKLQARSARRKKSIPADPSDGLPT